MSVVLMSAILSAEVAHGIPSVVFASAQGLGAMFFFLNWKDLAVCNCRICATAVILVSLN
jgi:hypothetical protein